MSNTKKKIIWAVDISQNPKEVKNIVAELKLWSKKINCDVLPVSVFPNAILDIPLSRIKKRKDYLVHEAQNDVRSFLKKAQAEEFLKPEVVLCSSSSNRAMAMSLLEYAESHKATMIFANSHTKRLWDTFTIGGFAFTLTSLAHIPVLLMNLKAKPTKEIRTIVFPTDFSEYSKNALENLKPFAKSLGSKVAIFNQLEYYAYFMQPVSKSRKSKPAGYVKEIRTERIETGKAMAEKLSNSGIPASFTLKADSKSLWNEINTMAKRKKAWLVALASTGGPVSQTILGSVTRNLVAHTNFPVLVFHEPKPVSQRKQSLNSKYRKTLSSERSTAFHM